MLKAGMWIAQGPETNVLLLTTGKEPFVRIAGAIDLNEFKKTGKAKNLPEKSPEIIDISTYPENYLFAPPSITEAVNYAGLGKMNEEEEIEDGETLDSMVKKGMSFYKENLPFYSLDELKTRTKLFIKREFNVRMEQSNYIYKIICKKLNRQE